ncbi:MAG: 16S rRNA (guanine(527)-N(7))-methyltransferase RsmG [Ruminococcus sp.]|nr:16S rRNA (guanine(527)-N(7))-methyltransferase RsmG [Ruminococcus sp.]
MIDVLTNALATKDIVLSDTQKQQFQKYYELLIEWNNKMNLTAITEENEVAIKHFYDSITLLMFVDVPCGAKVIDVGTGAGFPGIPLKIVRPDIKLTLLDSLNKRLIFLNEVCNSLGIDAEIIHKRAEEGGRDKKLRDKFDIATSRAVANMNTLSEYCVPYVKVGGKFVAMKGKNGVAEFEKGIGAVKILGGEKENVAEFSLPSGDERTIIVINKKSPTPKEFPRQSGKIKNKPLGII